MTELDLRHAGSIDCAGGSIHIEPDGKVRLTRASQVKAEMADPEIARSNLVVFLCGERWIYFVGEMSRKVWGVRPADGEITEVAELDRLNLEGAYDPGGLHYVTLHQLSGNDALALYEAGVARVGPYGPRWHRRHGQLTAHVGSIDEEVVWLEGEDGRFGVDLADGRMIPG